MISGIQTFHTNHRPFDDGRGLFPDRIQTAAPRGLRDAIKRAATMSGTTSAAFIRDAVTERLSSKVYTGLKL